MATIPEVIAREAISVLDHGFVRLDDAMASDLSVVNAARVSFARRKEEMDESDKGLIRFLMRERHGCYDDATDVLTEDGWKAWPDVSGAERFASMRPDGTLVYHQALRLVRKEFRGHLIGFKGASIDLMVTPDHRVLASSLTTREGRRSPHYSLAPAHSVLWKAHRHVATGSWHAAAPEFLRYDGVSIPARPLLRLLGLFVGDGYLASNHLMFNLRKHREISFLREASHECALELKEWGARYAVQVGRELRRLFEQCYDSDREKLIPSVLLKMGTPLLVALYEGLLASDGSVASRRSGSRGESYYTTSKRLADQVQELALKIGRSATVRPHRTRPGDGRYGSKPRWRVTIYNGRDSRPALCRTNTDCDNQMGVEWYSGTIHCVEVPYGTLYVRRNGYPVFCGNTPFEHNAFRFHVRAPIFVAREWFRHRIGSFNEFSMRYARATDDFYVPAPEDVRSQVGKPGSYTFESVEPALAEEARETLRAVYESAYAVYERLVEQGVARELARSVLPVGAYTEFYWTVNARALMNFVSLRAADTALREIQRYAEAVEQLFAERMPVTYDAFVKNDRIAP